MRRKRGGERGRRRLFGRKGKEVAASCATMKGGPGGEGGGKREKKRRGIRVLRR